MRKKIKLSVLLLAATIMFSSCLGSFQLTNKMLTFNKSLGDKWVNELVFAACCILPVYEFTLFIDAVVLNSIEFWTGNKLLSENVGENKVVTNKDGNEVEITTLENGYNLTDGNTSVKFVFDNELQIWSVEYNNQLTNLVKLVDENNAQLFLANGEVMDVTLDAEGTNMALLHLNNSIAMNK